MNSRGFSFAQLKKFFTKKLFLHLYQGCKNAVWIVVWTQKIDFLRIPCGVQIFFLTSESIKYWKQSDTTYDSNNIASVTEITSQCINFLDGAVNVSVLDWIQLFIKSIPKTVCHAGYNLVVELACVLP